MKISIQKNKIKFKTKKDTTQTTETNFILKKTASYISKNTVTIEMTFVDIKLKVHDNILKKECERNKQTNKQTNKQKKH